MIVTFLDARPSAPRCGISGYSCYCDGRIATWEISWVVDIRLEVFWKRLNSTIGCRMFFFEWAEPSMSKLGTEEWARIELSDGPLARFRMLIEAGCRSYTTLRIGIGCSAFKLWSTQTSHVNVKWQQNRCKISELTRPSPWQRNRPRKWSEQGPLSIVLQLSNIASHEMRSLKNCLWMLSPNCCLFSPSSLLMFQHYKVEKPCTSIAPMRLPARRKRQFLGGSAHGCSF